MTVSLPDYAAVMASRSPEYNRRIATHEIGHCLVARALGSIVDLVTIVPDGMFAGRCVRRGAPSPSLAFVDENAAIDGADAEPITQPTTENIVSVCAKIGAPEVGAPRVAMAEEMARAIVMVTELVGARCCERIFYPDHEPLPAEHDYIEAHALASVISSSPDALIRFCEAEAEALIRAHIGVATALIGALVKGGTIDHVDQIISDAIAAEMLAAEHERRREMQVRTARASQFKEMIANA